MNSIPPYTYTEFAGESIQLMQNIVRFMDNINRNFERGLARRTGRTRPLHRPVPAQPPATNFSLFTDPIWNLNPTAAPASPPVNSTAIPPTPRAVPRQAAPGSERRFQNVRSFWDPVEIGITEVERRQVVELLIFDSSNSELSPTCPISMANFTEGQTIHRIRGCGHIFTPYHLHRWFQNHTTCPVCRYDVRNSLNAAAGPSAAGTSAAAGPSAAAPNQNIAYIQAEFDVTPLMGSNLINDQELNQSLINLITNTIFPLNTPGTNPEPNPTSRTGSDEEEITEAN